MPKYLTLKYIQRKIMWILINSLLLNINICEWVLNFYCKRGCSVLIQLMGGPEQKMKKKPFDVMPASYKKKLPFF